MTRVCATPLTNGRNARLAASAVLRAQMLMFDALECRQFNLIAAVVSRLKTKHRIVH
jgi:hypothetical protein